MYCHNYLSFLPKEESREGVNILLFDNEEMICTLQHHFVRHTTSNKNMFRFTSKWERVASMRHKNKKPPYLPSL